MPPGIAFPSKLRQRPRLRALACSCALVVSALGVALDAPAGWAAQPDQGGRVMLAQANTPTNPTIALATVIVAEPGTETLLALTVGPSDDLPRNTFVRVRGLPARVSLSDGHAISPGTWAVPLFAITNLRVIIPPGMQGRSELTLSLIDIDGGVVAEARSALVVAPAALAAPATESSPLRTGTIAAAQVPVPLAAPATVAPVPTPAAQPEPKPETKVAALPLAKDDAANQQPRLEVVPVPRPAASVPVLTPEATAQAQRLVAFGKRQLGDGDIAAARNYFSRATDLGLAEGALRLAETYDPVILKNLRVQGILPNTAEARAWYEKARALGAKEADEPLKRLSAR